MRSISGHRGDDAGGHCHFTDAVVEVIRNVEVARRVQGSILRIPESRPGSRPQIPVHCRGTGGCRAGARHRANVAVHVHFTDAVVGGVANVHVARIVGDDAVRRIQLRFVGLHPVAVVAGRPGAGDRGNVAVRVHPANAMVKGIRNVQGTRFVYPDGSCVVHVGGQCVDVGVGRIEGIPVVAGRARSGHSGDEPGRSGHFTDATVVVICNVQVVAGVHGQTHRIVYLGIGRRKGGVIIDSTGSSDETVSGQRGNNARRQGHLANAVVARIGNVQRIHAVTVHPIAGVQHGIGSENAVAVVAAQSGAGDRGNDAGGRRHLAYAVIVGVHNVHIAEVVHVDHDGIVQLRAGSGNTVPVVAGGSGAGHRHDDAIDAHLTDAVAAIFRVVHVAPVVHGDSVGNIDARRECPYSFAADAPAAGHGHHVVVVSISAAVAAVVNVLGNLGVEFADTVVAKLCHIDIASTVQDNGINIIQGRTGGSDAVPVVSGAAGAGDGHDGTRNCTDKTDAGVVIRNVEIARTVHRDISRIVYLSTGGRSPVATGTRIISSNHGRDDAGSCRDFTHTVVDILCNVDVARTVQGDSYRSVHGGPDGLSVVPSVAGHHRSGIGWLPGDGVDDTLGIYFTHAVVCGVR